VDTSSADFKENAAAMNDVIARMKDLRHEIAKGGSQKAREKHVQRGKMLPREYVYPPDSHILHHSIDAVD
jgi:3-methylcrotonyl-CoA carboxylase beta subunit